jgi:hypothetical protein
MALDMLGQKISEGDYIIYPGRSGSALWVNVSRVVGIDDTKYDKLTVINTKSPTKKTTSIFCIDRVVKLGPEAIVAAKRNGVIKEE